MNNNISGISSYQQTNQTWNNRGEAIAKGNYGDRLDKAKGKTGIDKNANDVKVSEWKPIAPDSSLVPTTKDGYGVVVGNVELSDKAKEYYDKLKAKFHGMDFILVSKDMKSQVAANASAYGNANKPVVLIDDEKLERMATDDAFRKKYEGIIAMSQAKLQEARNSLLSSGASVKNFGMSIGSDGKESFFATVEKANKAQTKAIEKKQAEKKAVKAKEKKEAEKKAKEERIENRHKDKKLENRLNEGALQDKEYIEFKSDSIDSLINKVTKYAYNSYSKDVKTEAEKKIGQNFDIRG